MLSPPSVFMQLMLGSIMIDLSLFGGIIKKKQKNLHNFNDWELIEKVLPVITTENQATSKENTQTDAGKLLFSVGDLMRCDTNMMCPMSSPSPLQTKQCPLFPSSQSEYYSGSSEISYLGDETKVSQPGDSCIKLYPQEYQIFCICQTR